MKKLSLFFRKHWFYFCIGFILLIAAGVYFYNFENRWGLSYDQARDVIVAREALQTHAIPLIGPFSSAGQFIYGPQWFWVLMLMIGIYPNAIITPWVIQILLYIMMVFVMIVIGKEIGGKILALFIGLFTAVSPAQMSQATNLTSPSMVSIFSIATVYFFVLFIKEGKPLHAFLLGFFIATAINTHFQAIGLLVLIPVSLIFSKRTIRIFLSLALGLFIPFIPLLIFDLKTNFYETRGFLDYYFYGQYRIYVPNRWLTYAGVFWPNVWARTIGGNVILGYITIGLLSIITIYSFFKRNISKPLISIIISFLTMFIMLRYFRGERFDSYVVFLHPFILILTGWVVYYLFRLNYFLGVIACAALIVGSMYLNVAEIKSATNYTAIRATSWRQMLTKKFSGKKFALYDYGYKSARYSLPLVLFLQADGKLSDYGYKIGFGNPPEEQRSFHPEIKENMGGFTLRDLNSSSSAELTKEGWSFINPNAIYRSTEEWYVGEKL